MMVSTNFGLPRIQKILKADAYASALRMRVCAQTEVFVLHFCAHQTHLPLTHAWPQLGLVVPKKLAKHAIRRNTVKRLSRECFRLQKNDLSHGLWVIRLKTNINKLPLSVSNKRVWAAQLSQLFVAGKVFAEQYGRQR